MSDWLESGSRELPQAGTPVGVVGLGASGVAAARELAARGMRVRALDAADTPAVRARAGALDEIPIALGRSDLAALGEPALVVTSPGVPPSFEALAAAREAAIPVWSEVEVAYRIARAPILGVTGTNGKTTTARMLAAALRGAGYDALAAGNSLETVLVDAAAGAAEVIVAELSSFQLHSIASMRLPVAVFLNLAEDHLDWHGTMEAYGAAKARIFENQADGDRAVVRRDCLAWHGGAGVPVPFSAGPPDGGAGVEDGWIVVPQGRVAPVAGLRVRGLPNVENAVAAAAAACAFGADPRRAGIALEAFEPQPHRMEPVATIAGVEYVNDSKATNPPATLAALAGLRSVVLIAGGRNKGLDLGALAAEADRLRAVVAIGESAPDIERAFAASGTRVERAASMDAAVESAAAAARPGDTVLLSPACASYDWFGSYIERGEAFRAAVARIASGDVPYKAEGGSR